MKKYLIIALLALSVSVGAQDVKRVGKVFVQDTTFVNKGQKTEFVFRDSKGREYPIYLSKNGKAYVVMTSKKSGKQYKKYLPEVTKQLSK